LKHLFPTISEQLGDGKIMKKNGNGKGDENDKDRDEKGRFMPGKPGGPGRGKTKRRQELSEVISEIKELLNEEADLTTGKALNPLGRVLLHGITSKDLKVRTDSAKLYFNWLAKRIEAEEREKNDSNPTPEEVSRFAELVKLRQDTDVMDPKYAEEMSSLEEED
jgi:hypothetical protein